MCAIAGLITASGPVPLSASLAIQKLRHRGPDGIGSRTVDLPWGGQALLSMARLAIVDRSVIPVPFRFASAPSILLAYNGEVYNWRTLRSQLSDGTPWETECDAEVVARAFARWGPDALHRFNGMFAIAYVDSTRGEVVLARDRAGEKPLYFAHTIALSSSDVDVLRFASEPKGLGIPLKPKWCSELEIFEADCLGSTPLEQVQRLGPGERVVIRSRGGFYCSNKEAWWTLPDLEPNERAFSTEAHARRRLEELLVDACKIRVPDSGVPWTVQLSGGVDSAVVQSIVRARDVYTVTFPDDGVDNVRDASVAAYGARIHPVTFGLADLERELDDVAYHLDTPATWTAVCQWFMAKQMAADGVKVVLTGEGADELFGGYARYRMVWHLDRMRRDPLLAAYGPLLAHAPGTDEEILARVIDRSTDSDCRLLALGHVRHLSGTGSLPDRLARLEWHTTMQILLRMADRMNAAFAIENRAPFLDYRVIEFAARLPARFKIDERWTKAVVRGLRGVPESIARADTKRGLFLPWSQWRQSEGGATATRGAWDRASFAKKMREAWLRAIARP